MKETKTKESWLIFCYNITMTTIIEVENGRYKTNQLRFKAPGYIYFII